MFFTNFTVTADTEDTSLVYATQYTFVDQTTGIITNRSWDLGDKTFVYNTRAVTHTYNYPGTYNIRLTSVNSFGDIFVATSQIEVDYLYRDAILLKDIPRNFSVPGLPTPTTFKIAVTSAQIRPELNIDLYAQNSNSIPYKHAPNKWKFLVPTWRFTDKDLNTIEYLTVKTTPLYFNDKVVGVSGEEEFYYIDDTSTGKFDLCPLLLTFTLQTSSFINPNDSYINDYPSYANNAATSTGVFWKVYTVAPTIIDITENYLNNVYPIKWTNIDIPILLTSHGQRRNPVLDKVEKTGILFSFPNSNNDGLQSPITVSLCGVPSSYYRLEQTPIFFQKTDLNNEFTGGYIFTTVTPLSPIPLTNIQINTTITSDPDEDPDSYIWVSNPANNKLHRIFLTPIEGIDESCASVFQFRQNENLIDGNITSYDVPFLSTDNTFNYNLSGFSGIYGIAADLRNDVVYATDSELDRIYKFDTNGTILKYIDLSFLDEIPSVINAYTPSNIALDQNFNVYVSLFNSVSVLKFDKDLNFIRGFFPTNNFPYNIFNGDFLLKPPALETDLQNNLWVSYAHPLCSFLVKYNTTDNTDIQIPLDNYSVPVSLAINTKNEVWVANSYNVLSSQGSFELYSSTGQLLSTVTGYNRPTYITVDFTNNLWFTYETRNIGVLNPNSEEIRTWYIEPNENFIPFENLDEIVNDIDSNFIDEEIGGLAVDAYNRVCVIDSLTNTLYTFPASFEIDPNNFRAIKLLPDSLIGYVNNTENTFTFQVTSEFYKSAQATGDWTGSKWLFKYIPPLTAIEIQSNSTNFTVYDFDNPEQVFKVNQDFNTAEHYKSLALPEILNKNEILFDQFLGAVAGNNLPNTQQDIGQTIYEKIANFTSNHGDIDTCNIQQLQSLASIIGLPSLYTDIDFPVDINNFLGLASIPKTKLWGIQSPVPVVNLQTFGTLLDTKTSVVTANQKIILQNKFNGQDYSLITVPILDPDILIYPLSTLDIPGYIKPIFVSYLIYEYKPQPIQNFIENIIDWNNPNTTLSPTLSTAEDWLGDIGKIEQIFNYLLTKKLISK